MSCREEDGWMAYHQLLNEEREAAQKKAKSQRGGRLGGR